MDIIGSCIWDNTSEMRRAGNSFLLLYFKDIVLCKIRLSRELSRIWLSDFFLSLVSAAKPCELNCRAKDFGFYALLNKTVIDGTACHYNDPTSVCVAGSCKVGSLSLVQLKRFVKFYLLAISSKLYKNSP